MNDRFDVHAEKNMVDDQLFLFSIGGLMEDISPSEESPSLDTILDDFEESVQELRRKGKLFIEEQWENNDSD